MDLFDVPQARRTFKRHWTTERSQADDIENESAHQPYNFLRIIKYNNNTLRPGTQTSFITQQLVAINNDAKHTFTSREHTVGE